MNARQLIVVLGLAAPLGLASLVFATAAGAAPAPATDAAAPLDAGEPDAAPVELDAGEPDAAPSAASDAAAPEEDGGDAGEPIGIQPTTTPDNLGCRTAPGPAVPSFAFATLALGAVAAVAIRRNGRPRKS